MYSLTTLLNQSKNSGQARMVAGGVAVWICYSGLETQPMIQTLKDHGGILMGEDTGQMIWFFFDKEAYRGVARLQVWLRLKSQSIFFSLMPATFLVAYDGTHSLSVPSDLRNQTLNSLGEPEILVHPKLEEVVTSIPGLGVRKGTPPQGVASVDWKGLSIDPSFSYDAELNWYFVMKPLGKKLEYVSAWRLFFTRVEPSLQRVGVKFIYNDTSLSINMENVRVFRVWLQEIVRLLSKLKAESDPAYWPMVMAVVPRKGYNFNEELVNKVNLEWDRMTPDYPHVTYRDGYILGDEFTVNELGYHLDQCKVDDWCYVSLGTEHVDTQVEETAQLRLPRALLAGSGVECFYCGLKSHALTECPTRQFADRNPEAWEELARIPIKEFSDVATKLDKQLGDGGSIEDLLRADSREGALTRAMLEIGSPFQLRTLSLVWRSRSKDWASAFEHLAPQEGEYVWEALEHLRANEMEEVEALLKKAAQRYPRSYQPKSMAALCALEQGDMQQAFYNFSEAARFSYTPVQKIHFIMFQGRVCEISGDYERAMALYKEAETTTRGWVEAKYRQGVCLVKMGFTDHAMGIFGECLDREPHYFNRVLVDPELDRGRFQVQMAMGNIWKTAKAHNEEDKQFLSELCTKLESWFSSEHEFGIQARLRAAELKDNSEIDNYSYFRKLDEGCQELDEDIDKRIDAELNYLNRRAESYYDQLKEIMREASWFPYPALLREFNRDFNYCAEKLNWLMTQYLKNAENFSQAQNFVREIEERRDQLRGRLVSLRIMRDGTFFMLLFGKNFIWMQLVALALALLMLPLLTHFSDQLVGFLPAMVKGQKWQLQKGLIVVMSVIAIGLAALRTGVSFESKKQAFFDKEYEKTRTRRGERMARRQGLNRPRNRTPATAR